MKHFASVFSVSLAVASAASAQIVVDGTADANYGAALFTQNTNTQFGNSIDADPRTSNGGSEIDQVFGKVDNGFLYLTIAGNLEDNFNKLEIFFDSEDGVGQNTLDGANLPVAVDAFCCGGFGTTGGALQNISGLTFDAGFAADYYVTIANGTESAGDPLGAASGWIATAHYAELNNGSAGANVRVGGVLDPFGDELDALGVSRGLPLGTMIDQNNNLSDGLGTDILLHEFFEPLDVLGDPNNDRNHRDADNTIGMLMGVNQTNVAGVNGSQGPDFSNTGDPENVTNGIEISIPLAAIGNPTGDIKVSAFVNNGNHDFLSNQVTGGFEADSDPLSPTFGQVLVGNLATASTVNFANLGGDQFVTITQGGLVGDLDGDGFVGITDLNLILGLWNQTVAPGNAADPSGDDFIGIEDLNVVLGNWNAGVLPPPGSVVPEPTTLALLGLGGIAMLRRRR